MKKRQNMLVLFNEMIFAKHSFLCRMLKLSMVRIAIHKYGTFGNVGSSMKFFTCTLDIQKRGFL
jgi:hypothetical protein